MQPYIMQRTKGPLAFLLAQVGAHAAMRFGERISGLNLTPPDAGILRMLAPPAGSVSRICQQDSASIPAVWWRYSTRSRNDGWSNAGQIAMIADNMHCI